MSVELVNNHVLFPHDADWSSAPLWTRAWQTQTGAAVTGAQSRNALRAVPRHSLQFQITPTSLNEQLRLSDRVDAAMKLGLACAPFWGRACRLASIFEGGSSAECLAGWDWTEGDYIFFSNASGEYEVSQVATADFDDEVWSLTLEDVLVGTYRDFARPLIFGKFSGGEMEAKSPRTGPLSITITQLVNPRSAQLGTVEPPSGVGIGVMIVGDDFTVT